ncbi:MAG: hypothetical protein WCP30_07095 [Mycobacteriaceae bacterium]
MHLDAKTFARKLWVALAVAGGVVVVVLSWRVPEPETHIPTKSPLVENASYMKLVPQDVSPAPNYGARTN